MPISRNASIARTAHDRTHLNRLGVPEFGVVEIQIKGQGGSKSKSYRDGSSTTPTAPSGTGSESFHFAPGPQYAPATWTADATLKDDVQIVYTLHNPHYAIDKAKVEIFRRFDTNPVWKRDLKDEELLHGENTLKFNAQDNWDGKIDPHADFPDDFLTAEHSVYKLKLTVSGPGVNTAPTAWTYFHVIVSKLELEYGPKTILPVQPDNRQGGLHADTYDELIAQSATPPTAGTVKVFLTSNMFTTGDTDAENNSLYTRYETLWVDGPLIPLFCKVWVKSSADTDVVAIKALGKLKFLWDWESKSVASPTAFTAAAENYLVNKTKPKGRNCHTKRGGKRASKDKAVFPDQAGTPPGGLPAGAFPFKVEKVDKPRKWAAYSYAWNDGVAASKTGVMFQPSRMAGDSYKLTVYVCQVYDKKKKYKLNVDADAPLSCPDVLKAETGEYQTWRRVHVRKYVKKSAAVGETLNLATIAGHYAKAFLELKDETAGAIQNVAHADWNNRVDPVINGLSDARKRMIKPGDQYTMGGLGAYMRTRDEYTVAFMEEVGAKLDGLGLGAKLTPALRTGLVDALKNNPTNGAAAGPAINGAVATDGGGLSTAEKKMVKDTAIDHWNDVNTFMGDAGNGMTTSKYGKTTSKIVGKQMITPAFDPEAHADPGCTIFHVEKLNDVGSTLMGWAFDITGGNGDRCGFLLCATAADHTAPDNPEFTATHEFGHHFFLPHTPDAGEEKNYKCHDTAVKNCIMSYNPPTEFCGFCQLRLRGWSKDALKTSSSANSKT